VRTILILLLMSTPVLAADPAGHAKHHSNFYSKQMIPGKYRHTSKGIEMLIAGAWITPPAERVMMKDTPDAGGHWCGIEDGLLGDGRPHTYCAIVPIPGV
jgi:hypothetical protein